MAAAKIIPLVAGNWKMNGLAASRGELAKIVAGAGALAGKADLMVCPPATLIVSFVSAVRGSAVTIGGRTVMPKPPARTPAIFRPRCWPMPAPVP